jgi:ASC-1-like (ASCH) protein
MGNMSTFIDQGNKIQNFNKQIFVLITYKQIKNHFNKCVHLQKKKHINNLVYKWTFKKKITSKITPRKREKKYNIVALDITMLH